MREGEEEEDEEYNRQEWEEERREEEEGEEKWKSLRATENADEVEGNKSGHTAIVDERDNVVRDPNVNVRGRDFASQHSSSMLLQQLRWHNFTRILLGHNIGTMSH